MASLSTAFVVAAAPACGSRSPLDDDPVADAAVTDVTSVDVPADAGPADAAAPADAAREGGSVIGCGTCLVDQCSPAIVACVQSPACSQAFQCVITTCLSSGSPDPACLFGCASGDPQGAIQVLGVFQCVTGTCGADCMPLLAGLGGLGGGPGKGLGGGGKAKTAGEPGEASGPQSRRDLARAFSAWPSLSISIQGD